MADAYTVLEEAISDVGYWCWWAEDLPDRFQVEFNGVQLWYPPTEEGGPPSGLVALRFIKPSLVAFLTDRDASGLNTDWPRELHEDRIDPFSISYDRFTLTSDEQIAAMAEGCVVQYVVGDAGNLYTGHDPVRLGFRAGSVGLVVRAQQLVVISSGGELTPEQIIDSSKAWWEYWRDYWNRRGTDNPLPKDYACEVTIPLKNDC